ncbi:uncharacterized protein BXZ73DRAFT_99915 [Epithele typhae]|uniref:uncharacterized protein n=1 Tax=Epithele typhae TaxID=378194 RepID=UPI002007E2E0|nr:uncharacterized protein BXZ73DRAFT_99915 [Epithele typhae]KAH9938856.1 hypothetical protein BXZ73DRAFT_99915 [Epithele typhae]
MALRARGTELTFLASPWVSTQIYTVILSAFFFGITVAVTAATLFFLLRNGLSRRSPKIQLVSVLLLFVSTLLFFLFTTVYDIFISDGTVWWRACCVLWPGNIWVRCVCFLSLASTLGLGLVETYKSALPFPDTQAYDYTAQLYARDRFGTAAFTVSLANNVIATALIAFKAWRHARMLKAALGSGSRKSRALRILSLLIESGAVYCALGLFIFISAVSRSAVADDTSVPVVGYTTITSVLLRGCLVYVIGLYPMLITVIVRHKHSQLANCHPDRTGAGDSIVFAWPAAADSKASAAHAVISLSPVGLEASREEGHSKCGSAGELVLPRPCSTYVSAMSGERVLDLRRRQDQFDA